MRDRGTSCAECFRFLPRRAPAFRRHDEHCIRFIEPCNCPRYVCADHTWMKPPTEFALHMQAVSDAERLFWAARIVDDTDELGGAL